MLKQLEKPLTILTHLYTAASSCQFLNLCESIDWSLFAYDFNFYFYNKDELICLFKVPQAHSKRWLASAEAEVWLQDFLIV